MPRTSLPSIPSMAHPSTPTAFTKHALATLLLCLALANAVLAAPHPAYRWVNVTMKAPFTPRDGAGALTFNNRMWLIGGWNPRDEAYFPLDCVNDVWSSADGLQWNLERPNTFGTPTFNPARDWEGRHTAGYAVHRGKLWIIGGDPLQGHYQSDVWHSSDGKTWTHVNLGEEVPWGPRVLFHTLVFQDRIWILGGQTLPQYAPAEERFCADIWNSADGVHWTRVIPEGPHWSPRGMIGGSAVFQDRMWILGGGTYDTPEHPERRFFNDVWSSPDGVHWTCHTERAPWHPRQYHEVAVWDNKLWVLEGWNQGNRNDVWCSEDGVHWQELPNTPWKPRHAASVFVFEDALWMVAGNNMQPDVWKLVRTQPVSRAITEVLREPLPPEELHVSTGEMRIVIQGPTFRYAVDRATGAIAKLEVLGEDQPVVALSKAAALWLDDASLNSCTGGVTEILENSEEKVVLATQGTWKPGVPYTLHSTCYNDGVVVSEVTFRPEADLKLDKGIRFEVSATGRFKQYLHKSRDTNGMDCLKGALPTAGDTVSLTPPTSCLEVFSTEAALAAFTDRGGSHRSPEAIEAASLHVGETNGNGVPVTLTQHVIHIGPGGTPYTLPAGEAFTFRVGLAVAPNRLPHPRWRDLRMFIWVGDEKNPYPSDDEIQEVARLGFTLFQMHRLGTPGEPRPPAAELDRVIRTVHEAGMLFLWTANADLLYASAPRAAELQAAGQWTQWQGFNYGGRYSARMDPYCDLLATCLASPNGLADYRIECKTRMLDRYPVDGMYIDDNLPYANCTLAEEHGHPEATYDCLIELHDMNWRRRQLFRARCPHAVLIDHCSRGIILPAIAPFDGHLFGEGYSFPSIESYWDAFASFHNMPAAGSLFAGDSESTRCAAEIAYVFDLLTGGGQYCYLDWRLWPKKFPYAAGVHPNEALFVRTYNRAQYYFGLYEAEPYYFATATDRFTTTAPGTYATIYHNTVWNDALVVLANMSVEPAKTAIAFHGPPLPPLAGDRLTAVYDVNLGSVSHAQGDELPALFREITVNPRAMKLFYVRPLPECPVYHQWGGKRIAESWAPATRTLTLKLHGPAGLEDTVLLGTGGRPIDRVTVNGAPATFYIAPGNSLAHGTVSFGAAPITLQVSCGPVTAIPGG